MNADKADTVSVHVAAPGDDKGASSAPTPAHQPGVLSYATPQTDRIHPPVSALAIAAIAASVLGSPCILSIPAGMLRGSLGYYPRLDEALPFLIGVAVLAPIVLSVAAIVRVRRSGGRFMGIGAAKVALLLTAITWGLAYCLYSILAGF